MEIRSENTAMKSKKFVAYLTAELTWKVIIVFIVNESYKTGRFDYQSFWVVITVVMTVGFLEVAYILGQASLDKYLMMARSSLPSFDKDKEDKEDKKDEK